MKKIIVLFLSLLLICLKQINAQVNKPAGKISAINKNWQQGGIFNGEYPEKEMLTARTEYTKKFDKGNGIVDMIFGGPFHYADSTGAWQDINLNIKHTGNGIYPYVNEENKFISGFAQQANDGVMMKYKNKTIGFGMNTSVSALNWTPANSANPGVLTNENSITYKNLYNNVDVEYELTTEAILHRMKFNNKNVFDGLTQQPFVNIEETIQLPENAVLVDENGKLTTDRKVKGNLLVVVNNDTIYTILASHAWDASFTGSVSELGRGGDIPNGAIEINTSVTFLLQNKIKIIASVPADWLLAPNRIYPVVFDPTATIGNVSSFGSTYRYPFNTCRQQRVSQILFLKNDINAGGINTTGTITEIDFLQSTNNPIANNNIKIQMQEVSWNGMTSSTFTASGFMSVYGPSNRNFTSGGSNTWQPFTLITPGFPYSNTNNLLIEVSFNNSPLNTTGCSCNVTGPGGHWGYFDAPYHGHRWAYSNSSSAPPSGTDCNYVNSPEDNPAYGNLIPATKIIINTTGGCIPISISSNPGSQAIIAPAQAQFSVSASGTTPTYQWQVSTNGGSVWNNVTAGPYSGITTNQLTVSPTSSQMNGNQYRCVVNGGTCTTSPVTSNTAALTVNAAGCSTVLTPTSSPNIPAAGGGGTITSINVTPNSCSWSASANQSWINITSALNGTGDGSLTFTVAPNTGPIRTGTITINGQNYTVNQLGVAAANTYTITGRVLTVGGSGLPGVSISTTPVQGSPVITDAQGYYTITVPLNYTGTVTPSLSPFTFTPTSHTVSSSSYSGKDFSAAAVSITITSSVIPPWQREGDDYDGSITVNISNTTTNSWHLEADVYDANNIHMGNVQYPSTTSTTYSFNTAIIILLANTQLKNLSLNGRTVKYAAVFDANNTIQAYPGKITEIIEKKWNKQNIVYFNDLSNTGGLRLPIKYNVNLDYNYVYVTFQRANKSSYTIAPGGTCISLNETTGFRPTTDFKTNSEGYIDIKTNNSNLKEVFPGDQKYYVTDYLHLTAGLPTVIETGEFDLTKIGKISLLPNNSGNILIMIGGIFNEMENSANELRLNPTDAEQVSSNLSYSVIEFSRKGSQSSGGKNYSTWYIAQGNGQYITRNGFDIGIAINQIVKEYRAVHPGIDVNEIGILCHSKGGLDTRCMLTGFNLSMDGSKNYPSSLFDNQIRDKIKKIAFFDTPHRGASIATILSVLCATTVAGSLFSIPGAYDLLHSSQSVQYLNQIASYPPQIKFCNMTGYLTSFIMNDHVVRVSESHKPNIGGNYIQLYQNDKDYGLLLNGLFHMNIHKNSYLAHQGSGNYIELNCTQNFTNLSKVEKFFNQDLPTVGTCFNNIYNSIGVSGASRLTDAKYFLLKNNESEFIGTSDESGFINMSTLFNLTIHDSLRIESNSADTILTPITDEFLQSRKIHLMSFEKQSLKIQFPSLSLLAQSPITNAPVMQVYVKAKNAINFLINLHNSETIFTQLNLNNNTATIPLDIGYNKIVVKFCGIDTTVQIKEVYYLPDILMQDFAMDCSVSVSNTFKNSKMFVNNVFYKDIPSSSTFKLLQDINEVKFSKYGYQDTVFIVDTVTTINLSMQPYSYSSITDSTIFNFNNGLNPQYWKTITVKNLSIFNNVQLSAKQYDDAFTGMSLKPQTRRFLFRRLNTADVGYFKTAIALDQINTPDKDSVYLLSIKGKRWIKYQANQTGVTEYDPEVQKVEFDKLDFTDNDTHSIVLMQKQAPIMKNMDTLWHSGQTMQFPLSMFISDPDSIKNDITASSTDVKVSVSGNIVYVTAPVSFVGTTSYTLTGTHDFLDVSKTYTMKVIPPEAFVPSAFTPNNDGKNDKLKPTFMGKLINCHFTIFNRNGQKVFETTDCVSGWDGRINGAEQATGTFVWTLSYQFEGVGEGRKEMKGTTTLIR